MSAEELAKMNVVEEIAIPVVQGQSWQTFFLN